MEQKRNHIADFWKEKNGQIHCVLCPHSCILNNGETGFCRSRKNIDNQLISLVYGYPCALHIDPVEKKPLYHFYPGSKTFSLSTTGCNLHCLNCQNYTISQAEFKEGVFKYYPPDLIVKEALENGCSSVSYTYTDPVVYYEYARDIAVLAKEHGLKNIIVSAGYVNPGPLRDLCKVIDAANIDLKSFSNHIYKSVSQIELKPVLHSLEILKEENVWLEITNLIIQGYTDDLNMVRRMCSWLRRNSFENVPLHFSRFFPVYKLNNVNPTSIEILEAAYDIAKDEGLKYVYLGNVPLADFNATFCHSCGFRLIDRYGFNVEVYYKDSGKCPECGAVLAGRL